MRELLDVRETYLEMKIKTNLFATNIAYRILKTRYKRPNFNFRVEILD